MERKRRPRPEIARSRNELLDTAERLFERRGLEFSLNELAHEAELGVATTYRRFPTHDDLVRALHERARDYFAAIFDALDSMPDGWSAIVEYLERTVALNNAHPAFPAVARRMASIDPLSTTGTELEARLRQHVDRAHVEGTLRQDATPVDLVTSVAQLGVLTLLPEPARTAMSARQLRLVVASYRVESRQFGDLGTVTVEDIARLHSLATELPSSGRRDSWV